MAAGGARGGPIHPSEAIGQPGVTGPPGQEPDRRTDPAVEVQRPFDADDALALWGQTPGGQTPGGLTL